MPESRRSPVRRSAAALAAALALSALSTSTTPAYAAATPSTAARMAPSAGAIVYVCGNNLCSVDPATQAVTPLTQDGTDDLDYDFPALSADGSVLVFARDEGVFSGPMGGPYAQVATADHDVSGTSVSPDGTLVSYSWSYSNGYPYYTQTSKFMSSLSGPEGYGDDVNFLDNTGAVVVSRLNLSVADNFYGCVLRTPADTELDCATRLIDPELGLFDPAASPDGSLVATLTQDDDFTNGGIATWDPVTGAKTGTLLETGVALGGLTYSPDGGSLAYTGDDNGIWVIPATGGQPLRLTDGSSPTWGGSASTDVLPDQRLRLSLRKLKKGSGAAVPVSCAWSCTVSAQLTVSKKVRKRLGLSTTRVAAGRAKAPRAGTQQVKLKVPRKLTGKLRRGFTATLRVTVRPVDVAGAQTVQATTKVKVTR